MTLAVGLAASVSVPALAGDRSATTSPAAAGTAQVPTPAAAEWGTCPVDVVEDAFPYVLDCATVQVPMDYAEPGGEQIDLMISRMASTDPEKRRGILLLNPGGPSGSGLALPTVLASRGLPKSVRDAYDIIGMDTRGIGHSTAAHCGFTAETPHFGNLPPYAVDDASVEAQAEVVRGIAEQCAASSDAELLQHLNTPNTARDLDQIRAALGEEKASYLGYSYGSGLGATYDAMFPDRADRVVLDSNIGATHLNQDVLRLWGPGMEETFPDFARWAAKRHGSYGLGRTPAQVRATYFELAERLDEQPMVGVDGVIFRMANFGYLYSPAQYPKIAEIWESVMADDGAGVVKQLAADAPAGPLVGAPADPAANAEEPWEPDNALTVFLSVSCNDAEWPTDVQHYKETAAEDRAKYPMFGAAGANITPCAYWPYEPVEQAEISREGKRNILIVQNERDPATPLRGGQLARERFGDRSRLVTVDQSGHGAYVLHDNPCALETTTTFLVDGTLPKRDVACRAG
ncbi:alpha/beta hydrolase [Promicromonospora thailandica]|uniref:alpha/beta hydrolase n=1 Tax=Promicromonospora thailandica TaxID=765201 RepID=UPI0020A5EBC6|nr:alpha/beta hydrolase [Promicromonospora thailandica]